MKLLLVRHGQCETSLGNRLLASDLESEASGTSSHTSAGEMSTLPEFTISPRSARSYFRALIEKSIGMSRYCSGSRHQPSASRVMHGNGW